MKLEPSNIGALGNLGVVLSRTRRYQEAAEVYQSALKLAPNDRGLLQNLGLAWSKAERCDLAVPVLARAKAAELLAACELKLDHPLLALDALKDSPDTPVSLHLRGVAHYEAGHFEEAAAALEKTTSYRDLGKVYVSLRRDDEAETMLREALAQDPKDVQAAYYLGALLIRAQRYDEAEPHLQAARAADPDLWGSYYYLARSRLERKSAAEAATLLRKAAELNPKEPSIFYLLSRALQADGKPDEAQEALARWKALKSSAP